MGGIGSRLPDESEDEACPDAILLLVSNMIGDDVMKLGSSLDIDDSTLETIRLDYFHYGHERIAFKTLNVWRRRQGSNATQKNLACILQNIGRKDIATKILPSPETSYITSSRRKPVWKHEEQYDDPLILQQLQSSLRRQYRGLQMRGLPWMNNIAPSLKKHYVALEMIHGKNDEPKQTMELSEIFKKSNINASLFDWIKTSLVWVKTLLFANSNSDEFENLPTRILVEGDAGFGKTTLASKLCYDFSNRETYMNSFDLVLLASLKIFDGSLGNLLVNASYINEKQRTNLLQIISKKSVRTLLILDGYDELRKEHEEAILALIRKDELPHITLLVTSRPGRFTSSATNINKYYCNIGSDISVDCEEMWDRHVKVLGIGKDRQIEFIEKHLSGFSEDEMALFYENINQLKILNSDFLRCPLLLIMIVLLITEPPAQFRTDFQHLKSRTDLYKGVMNFVVSRYLAKRDDSISSTVDLFSLDNTTKPSYIDLMMQWGDFCLGAIADKILYFSRDYVLASNQSKDPTILDSGLLTKTISFKGFREEEFYEPVHRSLLEFGAAYYLWYECKTRRGKERILKFRPNLASYSSLLFPFLVGLMAEEGGAIFEVLRPYAVEFSACIFSLIPTLNEMREIDSVWSTLAPFLPLKWNIIESSASDMSFEILNKRVKEGPTAQIHWNLRFPTKFINEIDVFKLVLLIDEDMSPLNQCQFLPIKCNSLLCHISRAESVENKWKDLLLLFSAIQFQCISFWFNDASSTLTFLPLIHKAAINGKLKNAKIHWTTFPLMEETCNLLSLLSDLVQKEKVQSLRLDIYFLPSQDYLDPFLKIVAESSCLTTFHLMNRQQFPLTVNLTQLCDGGLKSYEWLYISNSKVIYDQQIKTPNFCIELLHVERVHPMNCLVNLLQSCTTDSFCGECSLILGVHHLIHESVSELNILVNETIRPELFACLSQFLRLKV